VIDSLPSLEIKLEGLRLGLRLGDTLGIVLIVELGSIVLEPGLSVVLVAVVGDSTNGERLMLGAELGVSVVMVRALLGFRLGFRLGCELAS